MHPFRRFRRALGALALLAVLALPLGVAHASPAETDPSHRIGVALAVVCGLSAKLMFLNPVPWAGLAVVSCTASCLDALNTPD